MYSILRSEWYKLSKSKIISILFVGPLVVMFVGFSDNFAFDTEVNEWYLSLFSINFTYGLLFLPLITGILASAICRYEHQAGGWKQLLTLPVTRGNVFIAKYLLLLLLVFLIQLLYLGAVFLVGTIKGFSDAFPLEMIWKSVIGGWVATFPLIALQLWMSMLFKNFAAPFAVNVIFTLPSIFAINSEKIGPYYPWAQPFSMMYVGGRTDDIFFIPWDQLITVVGGSFLLFFLGGYLYFQRKTV